MTPEQQRICIAEACGWKLHDESIVAPDGEVIDCEFLCEEAVDASWPDYINDLNAMHEAEMALIHEARRELYTAQLLAVIHEVDADYFDKVSWENGYELTTATASQRAEAFLRTLGKWQES